MQFSTIDHSFLLFLLIIFVASNNSANAVDHPGSKSKSTNASVVVAPRHFQAANGDQLEMVGGGPLVPQNRPVRQYGGGGSPQQFSGAMGGAQRGGYAGAGGGGYGFQRQASFAHTGSGPQFGYGGGGGFPGAAAGAAGSFNYRQPFQRTRSWWRWVR